MKQPSNDFKAIFNPFNRQLVVKYGGVVREHFFDEISEWHCFTHGADKDLFLHVQLDYDESLQLLFYPRVDNDPEESLNEDMGVYFNSNDMDNIPDKISIVLNDADFNKEVETFLK